MVLGIGGYEVQVMPTDEWRAVHSLTPPNFGRAKPTDAGFDLGVWLQGAPDDLITHGENKDYRTGIRLCLPAGLAARIVSRSSTFFKYGLEIYEGLIDPGYTGELRVMVINRSGRLVRISDGQRLAQVLFVPVIHPHLVYVDSFPATLRGTDGFGSTGK